MEKERKTWRPENIIAKVKHQWKKAKCDKSTTLTAALFFNRIQRKLRAASGLARAINLRQKCLLDKEQSPFNKS